MSNFVITTDYTCDIYDEFWQENNIPRMIMPIIINDAEYDLENTKISKVEMYNQMRAGAIAKTSQVNQFDALQKFSDILAKGKDVLHISFSSGVSSSFENFGATVNELKKKYPERRVEVIDSLAGAGALGIMVYDAINMQKQGKSLDDIKNYIENNKLKYAHYFIVQDLTNLKRSGRLSAIEATIGTILGIKPVLKLDTTGKIDVESKVRGTKKAYKAMIDATMKDINIPENDFIIMAHSDCLDDVKQIGAVLEEKTGLPVKYCELNWLIGAHVGPNTVSVFFKGKPREN